ncbi:MAG: cold-shock protein [Pseudomonadota bacterium]|nr:cold-shock protein [Pseudomonadota bacterium]
MATGRVKWFNNAKGYGFVRPDEGGEDLFVHYSYIQMEGYKSLKAGQPVEYEVQPANKGFHAVNLRADGDYSESDHEKGAAENQSTPS